MKKFKTLKKKLKRLSIDSLRPSSVGSSKSFASDDSRSITSETYSTDEELDSAADPASLQTTIDSLMPHDELHMQMRTKKAFHEGWQEAPVTFLPTYKYDIGSVGVFDSSEKKRGSTPVMQRQGDPDRFDLLHLCTHANIHPRSTCFSVYPDAVLTLSYRSHLPAPH